MKSFLIHALLTLSYYTSLHLLIKRGQKNTLTVLLYHGVAPALESGIYNYRKKFITPEQFERQIQYITKHYSVLKLDEATSALKSEKPLPPYPLAITFDDGYKNNIQYAAPILEKYSAPATIFVVTNFIDKKIPLWVDRLEYVIGNGRTYKDKTYGEKTKIDDTLRTQLKSLPRAERDERLAKLEKDNDISLQDSDCELYAPCSWEEVKEHEKTGITFGAHTQNHPILTTLALDEAEHEIANSYSTLKLHADTPSSIFAYPNGQRTDFNVDIQHIVQRHGFKGAVTTLSGTNTENTDIYALKRYTMDGTDSMITFAAKLTATLDWFRKLLKP